MFASIPECSQRLPWVPEGFPKCSSSRASSREHPTGLPRIPESPWTVSYTHLTLPTICSV
eukprot:11756845-Alexandrium_andersonii.AAC.1